MQTQDCAQADSLTARPEHDYHNKLLVYVHPECPNQNPVAAPAKDGDVGYDLKVWVDGGEMVIPSHKMANIRTGVFLKLPRNTWGDIRPRSSTFAKRQLFVMGGTIDEGYTGEISVFIFNPTNEPHVVVNGDRLAQLVICPKLVVPILSVEKLPTTERGDSGFGSTGGFTKKA